MTRPLVCSNHFKLRDFNENSELKAGSRPKVLLSRTSKGSIDCSEGINKQFTTESKIKVEPVEYGTAEELKFIESDPMDFEEVIVESKIRVVNDTASDKEFLDSILCEISKMSSKQKKFFKSEMVLLINTSKISNSA